jgi:zinc D-Ala-D-Ala carboxypeptidase
MAENVLETISRFGERSALAMQVFMNPNIDLAGDHPSKTADGATAKQNMRDSLFLMRAVRSNYENAPGGEIEISNALLQAMLELAGTYSYSVTEIAGGSHGRKSRHYAGVAMDVGKINGEVVSSKNKSVSAFMKDCRRLGATELLGPGNPKHDHHVHAAWPRPK